MSTTYTLASIQVQSAVASSGGKINCVFSYKLTGSDGSSVNVTSGTQTTNAEYGALVSALTGKNMILFYNDIEKTDIESNHGSKQFPATSVNAGVVSPVFSYEVTLVTGRTFSFFTSLADGSASDDQTTLTSVSTTDVPQKAAVDVISLDKALMFKISPSVTYLSEKDGYNMISSVKISLSGVFTAGEAKKTKLYTFPIQLSDVDLITKKYNKTMTIPDLLNGEIYEHIAVFFNVAGASETSLSGTKTPKDTPDVLINNVIAGVQSYNNISALSKLKYDTLSSVEPSSQNGGMVVYANWPADKTTLETSTPAIPITKVKVVLTKLVKTLGVWRESSDTAVEKEYVLPSTVLTNIYTYTSAAGIYNPTKFTDIRDSGKNWDFRFIISSADLPIGTAWKANVLFGNSNGYAGTLGSASQNVMSMLTPEAPLLKGHVIAATTADGDDCVFEIYRYAVPVLNGGNSNDYEYSGTAVSVLGVTSTVSYADGGNNVTNFPLSFTETNYTKPDLAVVKVNKKVITKGANPFMIGLAAGTTYNFKIKTKTVSEFEGETYYSTEAPISLIAKSKIASYKQIRTIAWNTDSTPVSINGSTGIKFQFKAELTTNPKFQGGFNGSAISSADVSIRLARNSQLVDPMEMPPIPHPGNANLANTLSFDIQQNVGTSNQYYIRIVVVDKNFTEIDTATGLPKDSTSKEFTSEDSSPALSNTTESYIPAVLSTGVVFERHETDPTKGVLKYNRQLPTTLFSQSGIQSIDEEITTWNSTTLKNLVKRIHNVVVIIDDATGNMVNNAVVIPGTTPSIGGTDKISYYIPWNCVTTTGANLVSLNIQNLVAGNSYSAYILAGFYVNTMDFYTSTGIASTANVFNSYVRKNYSSISFVAACKSSSPSTFKAFGRNASIYNEWAHIQAVSLNGGLLDSYEIAAFIYDPTVDSQDTTTASFPTRQIPIYSTSSNYALLTEAYSSRAAGVSLTGTKTPIQNDNVVRLAIRTKTKINSKILVQSGYQISATTGTDPTPVLPPSGSPTITYSTVNATLSKSSIDQESLTGAYGAYDDAQASLEPPTPTDLVIESKSGLLTAKFTKNTVSTVKEVRIVKNGVEFLNTYYLKGSNNYLGVDWSGAWSIYNSSNSTGLLFLQNIFTNQSNYSTAFGVVDKVKEIFSGVDGGKFVFNVAGSNGVGMILSIFHVDIVYGGEQVLSQPATGEGAPSSPPTAALNPTFLVDSNLLQLNWEAPSNTGGAGISVTAGKPANSGIFYAIDVFTSSTDVDNSVKSTIYSKTNVSTLTTTIGLPNSTSATYYVSIVPYYYNENDTSKPSRDDNEKKWFNKILYASGTTVSGKYSGIKVGPKPNVGTIQNISVGDQNISFSYQIGAAITGYSYPVYSLKVYVNNVLYNIRTSGASGSSYNAGELVPVSITGLLNGSSNIIKVEPFVEYLYAQAPDVSTTSAIVPYKPMNINAISITSLNKKVSVTVDMNGDPLRSSVIIAKDSAGVLYVSPILTGTFYTTTGSATATTAALQTASFDVTFANPITGGIVMVVGDKTTDIKDHPSGHFGPSIP